MPHTLYFLLPCLALPVFTLRVLLAVALAEGLRLQAAGAARAFVPAPAPMASSLVGEP